MKKSKKIINYIEYIIPILLILIICVYFYSIYKSKYITGTIILNNNEQIEIITDKDSIYKIKGDYNYSVGDYINIKYNKKINDFDEYQNINILNIQKSDNKKLYNDKLYNLLDKMTLEEKIGQLLLVRIPKDNKIENLKKYNFGGYILFQRDTENKTKEELINYINDFQKNSKIQLLIAIDEEGGSVSRLNNNTNIVKEPFLSPQELFKKGGYEEIKNDAIRKTNLLTELGINLNLAPVADITTNENSYIYSRSFGKEKKETLTYIQTIMTTQNNDLTYTLKHFPGYNDNIDTHTGISIDNRKYNKIKNNDFKPFEVGINNGAKVIMVSHNITKSIDINPSSLSRNIHNILRNELKFDGLIITDDLSMSAITRIDNPYLKAIQSGNNMLIVTDYESAFNEIYDAVSNQEISEELIDRLVLKVLQLKEYKKLI